MFCRQQGGQADYVLGSVHGITHDGALVIASAPAANSPPTSGPEDPSRIHVVLIPQSPGF